MPVFGEQLTLRQYVLGLMQVAYLTGLNNRGGMSPEEVEKLVKNPDAYHNKGLTEAELLLIEFGESMNVDLDQVIKITYPF